MIVFFRIMSWCQQGWFYEGIWGLWRLIQKHNPMFSVSVHYIAQMCQRVWYLRDLWQSRMISSPHFLTGYMNDPKLQTLDVPLRISSSEKAITYHTHIKWLNYSQAVTVTSIPWAVRLSWLEYGIRAHFVRRAILTSKVGQADLVFGVQSERISRSVHARLQVSVRSGYHLCQCHPG